MAAGATAVAAAAAAAAAATSTLDDRAAQDQRSEQQRAAAARGLRILTLLKQFTSQAFSGIVLHGTEGGWAQEQASRKGNDPPAALQSLEALPGGVVRVRFRVPAHLCSGGSEAEGRYLTAGAIMAWFDEVSSWAFICADSSHRPGVSISLTASILRWARAGQEVELVSKIHKTGVNLGFADITMRDGETGREMAHGRHVKFLVMGRAWEFFMSPLVFPVAHYFARRSLERAVYASPLLLEGSNRNGRRHGGTNGNGQGENGHHHGQVAPPASIHLDGLLGLEGFVLTDDGAGALNPSQPTPPVLKATARVRVAGRLCNNFGNLHGGAVSVLAERMAARLWSEARRMAGWAGGEEEEEEGEGEGELLAWPHARNISIDYMSPAPKGCEVVMEAWAAPLGPSPAPSPWPAAVSEAAAAAGRPCPHLLPSDPEPDDVGGEGAGSWLPSPGLVRVWFRRGERTLTQCHVQFDPPPARARQGPALPSRQQTEPEQLPQQPQQNGGGGGGNKRARRWSRL